ncbi:replication initiator protein [robinz microvirus RP_117]|nr:replication initiator protein [robinz microvirus RP_117]
MSCVYPLTAYWCSPLRGSITFDKNKSATKIPFKLPCGRCIGCRLEKARQWGLRCVHESKMWRHNVYVTLTYNDESLPPGGSLMLRDVQLFMKRLRFLKKSSKDNPLRFFLGGEYGEFNFRPHYHALLFNCELTDLVFYTYNKRGEPLYTSKELTDCWQLGHVTVGAVTFDSAVYCAKYALKKVNGEHAKSHYCVYDADGLVFDRSPEFAVMSRRPGIGAMYYEKYGEEIRNHDNVIVAGKPSRPARFYDERSELRDSAMFALIKKKRKRLSVLARDDNTEERLRVKEKLMITAAIKKERVL